MGNGVATAHRMLSSHRRTSRVALVDDKDGAGVKGERALLLEEVLKRNQALETALDEAAASGGVGRQEAEQHLHSHLLVGEMTPKLLAHVVRVSVGSQREEGGGRGLEDMSCHIFDHFL